MEDFEAGVDVILLTAQEAAEWRALAGYTDPNGVGVTDLEADPPREVRFTSVTTFDDVIDAIVVA